MACSNEDPIKYVGCCGAYCGTCRGFADGACKGCKLGYGPGERDIDRSRCRMKVCCLKEKGLETCADCGDYEGCRIIQGFYSKKGYKYRRYKQSIEYIRKNGYARFLEHARRWNGAYGKL